MVMTAGCYEKRGDKSISCLLNIGPVPPPQLSLVNRNDGENRGGFRILCIEEYYLLLHNYR